MEDEGETDVIQSLIATPFKTRPEADKKKILKGRRPQPTLKHVVIELGDLNSVNAPFDASWYVTYQWLAGCSANNRLYCWPCLLQASNRKKIWTKDGYSDFRILHAAAESHAQSKDHIKNSTELNELDPLNASVIPKKTGKSKQNLYLNNRLMLKHLIQTATTLCKMDLVMDHLEKETADGAKFKRLFELVIYDNVQLKEHCVKLGSIYTNMFSTILKDVIETMSHEILCFQRDELKKARFFSIQVDNAIDVSGEFLHTVIVRYVDESGDLQEHFLGFPVLCVDRDRRFANGLFSTIEAVLGFNSYKEKMISFSICGSSIQVKELDMLKKKIMSKAPEAMLIHSVSHRHKVILQQGINFVSETLVLFGIIQSLLSDFKRTENGVFFLSHFLDDTSPSHTSELHWSLCSKTMGFLLTERKNLINLFETRCNDPYMSKDIIIEANQFLGILTDHKYIFQLLLFQVIFKITDEFFDVLQKRPSDLTACYKALEQALQKLEKLRKSSDTMKTVFEKAVELTGVIFSEEKYVAYLISGLSLFQGIINNVTEQLKVRFYDMKKFEFLQLTDSKKFASYKSKFPTEALASLENAYGKHFKINQLKDELSLFIYSDSQFLLSPPDIVKQLLKADLQEIVPESYKLFCLVATLPITPLRGESCFQRLNNYLKTNKTVTTFTARIPLCVLMVQMPLFLRLEKTDSWYDKIINRFSDEKKKHKIEVVA